jgi:hypothetical protein
MDEITHVPLFAQEIGAWSPGTWARVFGPGFGRRQANVPLYIR